jgi:type III pantothenate kinase
MSYIIAIDAGNTHTRLALVDLAGSLPEKVITVKTERHNAHEYYRTIMKEYSSLEVSGSVISSVVPGIADIFSTLMNHLHGKNPVIVSAQIKLDFAICYDDPSRLGADRIANAAAAFHLYPNEDLLVFDVGTAMTVCALLAEKRFDGGMILPGPQTALDGLLDKTALPHVLLEGELPHLAARNTNDAIRSGLIWGYISMIDGLREKFDKTYMRSFKPVLTGGAAFLVDGALGWDYRYDPDLTMRGLKILYDSNC